MQLSWDLSPSRLAPKLTESALSAPQMGTAVTALLWLRTVAFCATGIQTGILFPAEEDSRTQAYPRALCMGLVPWRHLRKISYTFFP